MRFTSGEGKGDTGGDVVIKVGTGYSARGGGVEILSGDAEQGDGVGGYVNITAGHGTHAIGGRGGVTKISAGNGNVSRHFW